MGKLYPPLLEGTLPAFYPDEIDGEQVTKVTIPFSMNRAVGGAEVGGFALKLKTVQNSTYLYTSLVTNPLDYEIEDNTVVRFTISDKEVLNKLKRGQFYKVQLAYIFVPANDKKILFAQYASGAIDAQQYHDQIMAIGNIGHYSSVGIIKYTSKPTIYINDFNDKLINMHAHEYTGFYEQTGTDITGLKRDFTERVYQYRFDVYDPKGDIIATSGDLLHDSSQDVDQDKSYDTFILTRDLEPDESYRIKYTILTTNGIVLSTPRYRIMEKTTIDPEIKAQLVATNNFDNGYIDVALIGEKSSDALEDLVNGSFLLSRSSEDTNYIQWEEISRFQLVAQAPSQWLLRDLTIEQGKNYRYSIQQYNDNGLYSNRILSNIVYADFEDMFLFDGKRQLKVRYNPKVKTYKLTQLEKKMETIGSQYPFIFRNGKVNYHQFNISGLISYFMDEAKLFLSEEEFTIKEKTTNLISENLAQERIFKNKVLEWLTDGQPKLFRSPNEGNFIVRLINTSLTPNDKVGRMLHTFQSTAYEIAEYTYANMNSFNFINTDDVTDEYLRWETIEFTKKNPDGTNVYRTGEILNKHEVCTVRLVDMMPGDMVYLTFKDDRQEQILIGVTGSYYVDSEVPIKAITLGENTHLTGSMTYSYFTKQANHFNKIADVHVEEAPARQFIGEHDIIQEIEYIYDSSKKIWVKNPKVDILQFYFIHASKRAVEKLIKDTDTGKYYQDKDKKVEVVFYKDDSNATVATIDPFSLYAIGDWKKEVAYNPYRADWKFYITHYEDFARLVYTKTDEQKNFNSQVYNPNKYFPQIQVNDNFVSVEETQDFDMSRPGKLTNLKSGNGTMIEVGYQIRTIDYSIEDDDEYGVPKYKAAYETAQAEWDSYRADVEAGVIEPDGNLELDLRNNIKNNYNRFILQLVRAQEEEKKAEGL